MQEVISMQIQFICTMYPALYNVLIQCTYLNTQNIAKYQSANKNSYGETRFSSIIKVMKHLFDTKKIAGRSLQVE